MESFNTEYVPILVFCFVGFITFGYAYIVGRQPANNFNKSARLSEATVARQLVPRFDELIELGDILTIPGCDGTYYKSAGGAMWLAALQDWLDRGCTIQYLLVDTDPADLGGILNLVQHFPETFVLKLPAHILGEDDPDFLTNLGVFNEFRSFHPVILFDSEKKPKALWLEHFHEEHSHIAREVDYVAPQDIETDLRMPQLVQRLSRLTKLLVHVSPNTAKNLMSPLKAA
ncbi:MAG: hypothetical protein KUG74_15325 [Rhodobacteraceae bacterium]|nr:hypothetical protein [Paracoccaceae bacterium]